MSLSAPQMDRELKDLQTEVRKKVYDEFGLDYTEVRTDIKEGVVLNKDELENLKNAETLLQVMEVEAGKPISNSDYLHNIAEMRSRLTK